MKPQQPVLAATWPRLAAVMTAALLTACGGGGISTDTDNDSATGIAGTLIPSPTTPTVTVPSTPVVTVASTSGRLLASNCFQCHGTEGTGGFDNIRGESASEIKEYLRKAANSNIMAAHVQGYTVAQIDAIAAYLNR